MRKEISDLNEDTTSLYERRKQIMNTAAKLFIKKGYDATSVADLSEALNMSKAGLYYYIRSKEDVLHLVVDFVPARIDELSRSNLERFGRLNPTECLRRSIEANLKDIDELQHFYIFVSHVFLRLPQDLRRSIFENGERNVGYFEDLIRRGIQAGEFETENPHFVAFRIVVLSQDWATMGWSVRKHYSLQEYTRTLTASVLKELRVY